MAGMKTLFSGSRRLGDALLCCGEHLFPPLRSHHPQSQRTSCASTLYFTTAQEPPLLRREVPDTLQGPAKEEEEEEGYP